MAPSSTDRPDLVGGTDALDAQAELLPYALALFGVSLPIYFWAGSFADDRMWLFASLALFAIDWAYFYAFTDWRRRTGADAGAAKARARLQLGGGLLWSVTVLQIAMVANGAGLARETLLALAVGAACMCAFFSAPHLPALLLVGPAAGAAPVAFLLADGGSNGLGRMCLGALSLALAFSLVLNRAQRRQFALSAAHDRLVAERALSLARAERLAKARSDLLSTLAQEIREGLTGASHMLAAASSGGRAAPSRDQIASARRATDEILAVLNSALDLTSAEADGLSVACAPFDLAPIARACLSGFRSEAERKGIELAAHIDESFAPGGAWVCGDPARTRQALDALVSNAVRYTARGRVEMRLLPASGDSVRIEVVDSGPGLSEAELAEAFEPFRRVSRTSEGAPGAGVGLPLASRLATLMGGTVDGAGMPGVGCRFSLTLPAAQAPGHHAPGEDSADAEPADAGLRRRVLIAEEDPLQAAMLRAILERLGHHVLQANDGRRAGDLAETCPLDVIVLADRAPNSDPAEIIRRVRALPEPAGTTPIILVTAGEPAEARQAQAAGADLLLRRPLGVASVARAIATVGAADLRPAIRRAS